MPALHGALSLAAALVLLLSGCAKEDGFAPCNDRASDASGDAKSMPMGSMVGSDQLNGKPTMGGGRDTGSSISDDGDDVGDGERSRKKKTSN